MTPYGKVAQAAICAASVLAENYTSAGAVRLSSGQIAEKRNLSQAIVGKVLTTLSQSGLVVGAPGPGGGYMLARPPKEITLYEVVSPFDRLESNLICPYGEGWCGNGPPCPLHTKLESLRDSISSFLQTTTLAKFQKRPGMT